LGIEMGVKVDKAGRHRQAIGVNNTRRAAADSAGFDDAAVFNCHVTEIGRHAATVDDPAAFDE
jgi:hypothetical protein